MLQLAEVPTDTTPPSTFELTGLDEEAMGRLASLLDEEGYVQQYLALTHGALYVTNHQGVERELRELRAHERGLLELLALGRTVELEELAPWRNDLAVLQECGLMRHGGSAVSTTGWIVAPMLGSTLLAGIPSTYPTAHAIGAPGYVGNDSMLLAASIPETRGRRFLDLGASNGVQGICAAIGASEAVLTDIDAFGLRLAALNVALAKPEHPVRITCGDTYAPVQDERFDLIVALPPYVPTVEDSGLSEIVAGGPDGLGFIRGLLEQTTRHLAPGGRFIGLAQLLCDDDGPLLAKELDALTPSLSSHLSSFDWAPLQPYLLSLTANLVMHGATMNQRDLIERYTASLRSVGVTGVCSTLFTLAADPGAPTRRHLGPVGARTDRFVPTPAGAVRIVADPNDRHAVVADRDLGTLPGPTLALLAAADGRRTVAECAIVAWGLRSEVDAASILDQAIARFSDLERLGALTLGPPNSE